MTRDLDLARQLVADAHSITILTGAGLSTASGIPDFRGPQGVWTQDPKAERISILSWYLNDPEVRRLAWQSRAESPVWEATPNPAHLAITALQRAGRLRALITSNTDGLHQLAGTEQVLELHGSDRDWRCESCHHSGPMAQMLDRVRSGETDPGCPDCGGIVRATTILFEEQLDPDVIDAASQAAADCDLFLAAGTSLVVYPAAGLLPLAMRSGAQVIIMNAEQTPFDRLAAAVIHDPLQTALPAVLAGGRP